jgi:hypothetical protein
MRRTTAALRQELAPLIREKDLRSHDDPAIDYTAGDGSVYLDGRFTADRLDAIARWIREHRTRPKKTEA